MASDKVIYSKQKCVTQKYLMLPTIFAVRVYGCVFSVMLLCVCVSVCLYLITARQWSCGKVIFS